MSTLRDPVGPKNRAIYVRRRILVLVGIVAVIAVIVLIIVKPGGSGPTEAQSVNMPSDAETTPSADDQKSSKKTPECESSELRVTAITDKTNYAVGELPKLSLSVENTASRACTAELGNAGMQFTISSGDDEVWRSADCQTDPKSLPVILDPGKPLESEAISWDRTRSSPDTCDKGRDPLGADGATYRLQVAVSGVTAAEETTFLLN